MKLHHFIMLSAFGCAFGLASGWSWMRVSMMEEATDSLAAAAALSFQQESDPALAADAMPFALKTLDMLALQQPDHPAILLAAAKSYIQYSAAFLDWEARKIEDEDFRAARDLRQRAARLYLRGRDYAAAALESRHPGFNDDLLDVLPRMKPADVPYLYWFGAGWAAAIAANPSDMSHVASLPLVEAVMRRAVELDPDFDRGALHDFFVLFEGGRGEAAGGNPRRAEEAFERAVQASAGELASPYVSLATTVMIQRQDAGRFKSLLEKALAIDPDANPDVRLANIIARDKARWYLTNIDNFFLETE
ncbi:MAG: TRAP transporter TatT component family protein [Kiritimatiellia bacterium]